jgi:hypothetical protein
MRFILLVILLVMGFGSSPLFARIGETLDECKKRYGPATPIPTPYEFAQRANELSYFRFVKRGIFIQAGFFQGKAVDITFSHAIPAPPPPPPPPGAPPYPEQPPTAGGNLTQVEIDMLLKADSGGKPWKTVTDGKLTFFSDTVPPTIRYGPYRQRDDGVIATVDTPYLHIFTPQWMAYVDAMMTAYHQEASDGQKKNLEGF